MTKEYQDEDLLFYLNEVMEEDEIESFEEALASNQELQSRLSHLQKAQGHLKDWEPEEDYHDLLVPKTMRHMRMSRIHESRGSRYLFLRVAAVFAICTSTCLLIYFSLSHTNKPSTRTPAPTGPVPFGPVARETTPATFENQETPEAHLQDREVLVSVQDLDAPVEQPELDIEKPEHLAENVEKASLPLTPMSQLPEGEMNDPTPLVAVKLDFHKSSKMLPLTSMNVIETSRNEDMLLERIQSNTGHLDPESFMNFYAAEDVDRYPKEKSEMTVCPWNSEHWLIYSEIAMKDYRGVPLKNKISFDSSRIQHWRLIGKHFDRKAGLAQVLIEVQPTAIFKPEIIQSEQQVFTSTVTEPKPLIQIIPFNQADLTPSKFQRSLDPKLVHSSKMSRSFRWNSILATFAMSFNNREFNLENLKNIQLSAVDYLIENPEQKNAQDFIDFLKRISTR